MQSAPAASALPNRRIHAHVHTATHRVRLGLLVVISMLTYTLLFFSGTSIARNILGEQATPEQIALKEAELGLDQPLPVRYLGWAGAALRGDLGQSWFNGEPVTQTILNRLPAPSS